MSAENIIIYGAGGLGREVLQMVRLTLCKQGAHVLGFVDDQVQPGTILNDTPVLGNASFLESVSEPVSIVLGFAAPGAKEKVYSHLKQNPLFHFPNIIHPQAQIEDYSTIGEGVILARNVHISVNVRVGNCVLLNSGSMVGHDASIGDFSSVMPLVAISGNVTIGERTMVGVQSALKQGIQIGSDCTIGMGSIVLRSISDGVTTLGNPARPIS